MAVPGIDKFDFCLFVCLFCSTMFRFCFWRILFFFLEKIDPWAWETFVLDNLEFVDFQEMKETLKNGTENRLSFHDFAKELFVEFDKDDRSSNLTKMIVCRI